MKIMVNYKIALTDCYLHRFPAILIKKQMTIPYKHTYPIMSCCMLHSELLFPRICTNSSQTSIEDEYP